VRVAFYTAGDRGGGHLARGVAIGRALARRGFTGQYKMFGPPLAFAAAARPDWRPVAFTTQELEDPGLAPDGELARALRAFDPDLVVVDLFWAPLMHVLPVLRAEAWLLLRICPHRWLAPPHRPQAQFDPRRYARVIGIEPFVAPAVRERIDPVVCVNHEELRPKGALRARLGVDASERLVVVVQAGFTGEGAMLRARAEPLGGVVRLLDLHDPASPFPAAEWLGDADVIVAGAGYNAFWEGRWLGHGARTVHLPMPRPNDDQALRMELGDAYTMKENGADTLARMILGGSA